MIRRLQDAAVIAYIFVFGFPVMGPLVFVLIGDYLSERRASNYGRTVRGHPDF